MSHLSRGAWIEMISENQVGTPAKKSHLSRGAWIEIGEDLPLLPGQGSHLSRGAWIEIASILAVPLPLTVAPLTGCVD